MGLATLLLSLLNIFSFVLLGRALMSWFDPTFSSAIGQLVFKLTEPVVEPVRRIIRPMGGLDLSIIVTILLVFILRQLIASSL